MSERDFYEGADYAVKCGALTDTEAFNAVCDDLAKAHTEIERLRADIAAAERRGIKRAIEWLHARPSLIAAGNALGSALLEDER